MTQSKTTRREPCIPAPEDVPFPGTISLHVDARDVERRIFRVREVIPVAKPGPFTLLFPEWLPGYHAPRASIELFAGLVLRAGETQLPWRRHPVQVHAFHVDVPEGVDRIEASFHFLTPTDSSQGRVVVGAELLSLQWNSVLLYPAGHHARQIAFDPHLVLPEGWRQACALARLAEDGSGIRYETVPLDVLVDSPVFAGRHAERVTLDDDGQVHLNIFADSPDLIALTPDTLAPHRGVVEQADRLFGARPFDRYEVLFAVSAELGSIGVEHHRSCEAVTLPGYFTDWQGSFSRRDTIPHEFIHSWNGKYRRGEDSWTPSFDQPIRNSLMWVYEGQTQYWDRVLCARSGLWTPEQAMQTIAVTAATHAVRAGSRWRPMSDTTRDPIIAARAELPWPSWQRSEDYYSEGALVWLDVDTRIRELSGDTRSLDDFARAFFAAEHAGTADTRTYRFDDVIAMLHSIAPFDWAGFFQDRIDGRHTGAPLEGLERGGYRLVYREEPSEYWSNSEKVAGNVNLLFSLGLIVGEGGKLQEVLWEGPAYDAALTVGTALLEVDDDHFSPDRLRQAVSKAKGTNGQVRLKVRTGTRERDVTIQCPTGHRYPHLERVGDSRPRLLEILAPRS
jgi:predicted metalloprotease with PDZ domain